MKSVCCAGPVIVASRVTVQCVLLAVPNTPLPAVRPAGTSAMASTARYRPPKIRKTESDARSSHSSLPAAHDASNRSIVTSNSDTGLTEQIVVRDAGDTLSGALSLQICRDPEHLLAGHAASQVQCRRTDPAQLLIAAIIGTDNGSSGYPHSRRYRPATWPDHGQSRMTGSC